MLATYFCGSSFERLPQLNRNLLARKQIKIVAKDNPGHKVLYIQAHPHPNDKICCVGKGAVESESG